jgi:molybdate transport system permease protein
MDWVAIGLTLKLASFTTAVLFLVGLPLSAWLASATSARRWKTVVEAVVALPLVLPPTVLGFYLLLVFGPKSPIGAAYESMTGRTLPFSFAGLVVGSSLYSLPFLVGPLRAAFASVDRRLIEASFCLGVSRVATFVRIICPLSWSGIVTGAVLTFAHTVGEFGVVLMIGGNIPGVTRTASIAVYDQMQSLDYAGAGKTSALLLAFSLVVLGTTYGLSKRPFL